MTNKVISMNKNSSGQGLLEAVVIFVLGLLLIITLSMFLTWLVLPRKPNEVSPMEWEAMEGPYDSTRIHRTRTSSGHIYKINDSSFFVPDEVVENGNDQ